MLFSKIFKTSVAVAMCIVIVVAENHTVTFTNKCGRGTPLLKANGQTLSTGGSFTINGPLVSAIAFLQTGNCGDNGEGCTLVETTLQNPTTPGSGSSTDISLIPPHAFSVSSGFGYFNGCDGQGADCTNANCPQAFFQPDDTHVQVACQTPNVNLAITFCD
ncbi:glycopeptide [Ramaria rubella]|nr:glycopeptide [Ramaria rubella]